MKAALLFVELKREFQHCEHEVNYLMRKLPAGWKKVIYGSRVVAFTLPPSDILPKMKARLHHVLQPFENYWFVGLSGEIIAKNGPWDPLASAVREYTVPPLRRREPSDT